MSNKELISKWSNYIKEEKTKDKANLSVEYKQAEGLVSKLNYASTQEDFNAAKEELNDWYGKSSDYYEKDDKQLVLNTTLYESNLKLINENREKFDKATKEKTEQLKEAVRRSQEENTKKMAELQNQQVEAKKAADKRIQEIESKSKSDLDETQRLLNEKHKKELQDKIDALTITESEIALATISLGSNFNLNSSIIFNRTIS